MAERESVFFGAYEEDRVFAENEYAFAFPTNIPITPGHSLVVPKRVVSTIEELHPEELIGLIELVRIVKAAMKVAMHAEGFQHAWNEGADFGQSVSHLHLHVVPRTVGDSGITEYEPRKFLYRPGSREQSPVGELVSIADTLRFHIADEG